MGGWCCNHNAAQSSLPKEAVIPTAQMYATLSFTSATQTDCRLGLQIVKHNGRQTKQHVSGSRAVARERAETVKKLPPSLISVMNICNKTDVGANNADMSSTTHAPNSVMKNKNSNMEQHKKQTGTQKRHINKCISLPKRIKVTAKSNKDRG